jgi:hypothetical protein
MKWKGVAAIARAVIYRWSLFLENVPNALIALFVVMKKPLDL